MGVQLRYKPFNSADLLEEPTPSQLKVLEYVLETFVQNERQWPVFDYVEGRFDGDGIDVWTELQTLPAHPQGYYAVALPRQRKPEPDARVALTMLGLYQAEAMQRVQTDLASQFLAALNTMATWRRNAARSANVPRSFEISSDQLIEQLTAGRRDRPDLTPELLADLMNREPPTWGGTGRTNEDGWVKTITRAVAPFSGVTQIREYLGRLVETLALPEIVVPPAAPSPLALVAAIDYLDTVWRLAQPGAGHLFQLHSAQRTAQLAFDANTAAEFESRLSGLGDVLRSCELPADRPTAVKTGKKGRDKPLGPLERHLLTLLPESQTRIESAIAVLHSILDVRDAGQHAPAGGKGATALATLGIGYPPASWPDAWSVIGARAIEVFDAIREELAVLT